MNSILGLLSQYILIFKGSFLTFKTQIILCFIISIISVISLPMSVKYIGGLSGFILSCGILLIQGIKELNLKLNKIFY